MGISFSGFCLNSGRGPLLCQVPETIISFTVPGHEMTALKRHQSILCVTFGEVICATLLMKSSNLNNTTYSSTNYRPTKSGWFS